MVFVETEIYTKQIDQLLTDEEQRELQLYLRTQPTLGARIQGTGGIRKLRFAQSRTGKGKRSGIRVIYLLDLPDTTYLLLAYPKGKKDDLSNDEKRVLKKLAQTLKDA